MLKKIPGLDESSELPSIRDKNHKLWDLNRLFLCLVYENKPIFLKGLELVAEKRPEDLCILLVSMEFLLIQLLTKININSAYEMLISAIKKLSIINNDAIETAIEDHKMCLEKLKKTVPEKNGICIVDFIESAKQKLCCQEICNSMLNKYIDHEQCLDVLIDWDKKVVFQCDEHSKTALHYAVQCKNQEAIKKLLKKGAYIGMDGHNHDKNCKKSFNIQNLNPKLLEQHFDSCISIRNEHIVIDFKNLIDPPDHEC